MSEGLIRLRGYWIKVQGRNGQFSIRLGDHPDPRRITLSADELRFRVAGERDFYFDASKKSGPLPAAKPGWYYPSDAKKVTREQIRSNIGLSGLQKFWLLTCHPDQEDFIWVRGTCFVFDVQQDTVQEKPDEVESSPKATPRIKAQAVQEIVG